HTRFSRDWSSDVCSSDLVPASELDAEVERPDQEGEDRDEEDRGRDAVPDLAPANDLQVGLAPVEPAREILQAVARRPHGSRRPKIGRASCRERVQDWEGG